jgi:hypothetical protein
MLLVRRLLRQGDQMAGGGQEQLTSREIVVARESV